MTWHLELSQHCGGVLSWTARTTNYRSAIAACACKMRQRTLRDTLEMLKQHACTAPNKFHELQQEMLTVQDSNAVQCLLLWGTAPASHISASHKLSSSCACVWVDVSAVPVPLLASAHLAHD